MRVLEAALGILIVGLVLIGVLLLEIFPYPQSSLTGWVVLVVVGIPLYMLLGGLAEAFFSEKVGRRTSDKDFSGARILIGLVAVLRPGATGAVAILETPNTGERELNTLARPR
jgi:hypothetical protein